MAVSVYHNELLSLVLGFFWGLRARLPTKATLVPAAWELCVHGFFLFGAFGPLPMMIENRSCVVPLLKMSVLLGGIEDAIV